MTPNKSYTDIEKLLRKVTHPSQLIIGKVYTLVTSKVQESFVFAYYDETNSGKTKRFLSYNGLSYELSAFIDNDDKAVYEAVLYNDVIIDFSCAQVGYKCTLEDVKVQYKAYKENIGTIGSVIKDNFMVTIHSIAKEARQFYEDSLNGIIPEVHIIGATELVENLEEPSENNKEAHNHADILKEYHSVVAEISEASRQINQNTRLEDLKDLSESFLATREKLKELSGANASKVKAVSQGLFAKFKGIPLIGRAITATNELKDKTNSVQDNIDALFILINKQYNRLVEVGEGLQNAKKKQETQCTRLEKLIIASDAFISSYNSQSDIPIRELSANNQIKTSYEKLRKRILKTEAAIMGTQASIISLGKDLPCSKSEMTEELALSGLLNSVTDYQTMYSDITTLLNEVVEVTSEKTYKVVENLMDLQINDTHTLTYLSKDNQRAKEFATMLTDKSQKLADKVKSDANMIKEIASGTSILEAREKVKSLGYNE